MAGMLGAQHSDIMLSRLLRSHRHSFKPAWAKASTCVDGTMRSMQHGLRHPSLPHPASAVRFRHSQQPLVRTFSTEPTSSAPSAPEPCTTSDPLIAMHTSATSVNPACSEFDSAGWDALPFYSHYPLDRKAEWRKDTNKLSDLLARSDARLLPLANDRVLVSHIPSTSPPSPSPQSTALKYRLQGVTPITPAPPPLPAPPARSLPTLAPVTLEPAADWVTEHAAPNAATIFLGVDDQGVPYFAVQVRDRQGLLSELTGAGSSTGSSAGSTQGAEAGSTVEGLSWKPARLAGAEMSSENAALLATASGLNVWHAGNGFHAQSGSPTVPVSGGSARKCTSSNASIWPRIDPAVIMLVTAGTASAPRQHASQSAAHVRYLYCPPVGPPAHMLNEWCLLGRKPDWEPGRYSTLAGFIEVGEPMEVAVARETREESGVTVDLGSVTYCASQPWPFPRSLMVGFYAVAAAQQKSNGPAADSNGPCVESNGPGVAASGETNGSEQQRQQAPAWAPRPGARGYDLLPHDGRRAAIDVQVLQQEVEEVLLPVLPTPVADREEMEDVRWFHRDFLKAAIDERPLPGRGDFIIPGPWSLAYRLITGWVYYSRHPHGGLSGASSGHESDDLNDLSDGGAEGPQVTLPPGVTWAGDLVPQVAIDDGSFKYVLLRLHDGRSGSGSGRRKLLVWGDRRASYHMDLYQKAKSLASKLGLSVDVLGGGRIEHHESHRVVHVYGYSGAFGTAPHELSVALIRKWYPLYNPDHIYCSYEGY